MIQGGMYCTSVLEEETHSLERPLFGLTVRLQSVMAEQDRPLTVTLPPKDLRIITGILSKKVMTVKGIKWQPRHGVLSADHLFFLKRLDDGEDGGGYGNIEELSAVFQQHDINSDGYHSFPLFMVCH